MALVVSGVFLFKERYFTKIWGTGIACNNKLRMEGIRGGHFEHGFFVGMASAAGGSVVNGGMCDRLTAAERVAVNAALGGIVSEIGGGKFASGAMTGAYVMMFNELKHTISDSQLKKYMMLIRMVHLIIMAIGWKWMNCVDMLEVSFPRLHLKLKMGVRLDLVMR